jgi:very-short-patch-repair endonuclease
MITINDNKETVTCRLCGEQCKRIYGKHLKYKHNNISTNEYKEMFPGAPIMALSDRKNTTKNSGSHMKLEKYKKMFSEKIKGDKNPNHKSKTTEDVRKSRSPFSKDFIKYKDVENIEDHISEFVKNAIKDRISNTTIQYYINKGYSEEESKKELSKRQKTFSLDICVEKYGEIEGEIVWMNRQKTWFDSINKNGSLRKGYSNISQVLFQMISNKIDGDFRYATNGGEYSIKKSNGVGVWFYDFTDIIRKKIIEYQGDQYHANPNIYKIDDNPHPFRKNISSKDIWDKDSEKLHDAESNGYEILYIWDSEYKKNKNKIVEKCIKFLTS